MSDGAALQHALPRRRCDRPYLAQLRGAQRRTAHAQVVDGRGAAALDGGGGPRSAAQHASKAGGSGVGGSCGQAPLQAGEEELVPGLEAGGAAAQRAAVSGAWGRQRDRMLLLLRLLRLLRQRLLWLLRLLPFLCSSGVVVGGGDDGVRASARGRRRGGGNEYLLVAVRGRVGPRRCARHGLRGRRDRYCLGLRALSPLSYNSSMDP